MPIRAILDTNVFLSALWSNQGAAYALLTELRLGRWQMVLSNHLLFEYEEIGKRHATEMEITVGDVDELLDALCVVAEQVQLEPAWIPQLSDPDDEPLLQMAVEARVPIIVTRNYRHLKIAESYGIEVLSPAEFLAKIRSNQ